MNCTDRSEAFSDFSNNNVIRFPPNTSPLGFDDTVVAKPYGKAIQPVRRQWSSSEKPVVEGIGIVMCVYVTLKTRAYWIINYHLYDVDRELIRDKDNRFLVRANVTLSDFKRFL